MLLQLLAYSMFDSFKTGVAGIYDVIYKFYGGQQLPAYYGSGVYYGYTGCTRIVLEYTLCLLRENYALWFEVDDEQMKSAFNEIAAQVAQQTGADATGIYKWCFWVFNATRRNETVRDYMSGGSYGLIDAVTTKAEEAKEAIQQAAENIEYGLTYQSDFEKGISSIFGGFKGLLPVVAVVGGLLLMKKIID